MNTTFVPKVSEQTKKYLEALLEVDNNCLQYKIRMNPLLADKFLNYAITYNNMRNMETIIKEINNVTPTTYFNEGNPNNGSFAHYFEIGNESSRVIYVTLNKYYAKNTDFKLWAQQVENIGKMHGADETSTKALEVPGFEQHGRVIVRLWWD
jgi:hypothetical protein